MTRAVEQLQAAQVKWSRKRSERLDWINENLRRQGHAVHTFRDVDEAIRQYNLVSGSDAQTDGTKTQALRFLPTITRAT